MVTLGYPAVLMVSHAHFTAEWTAASRSRSFVRDTLKFWGLLDHLDTAELVTSELVTNAVKSTGTIDTGESGKPAPTSADLVGVQVRTIDTRLYIEVWDSCPELPHKQSPTTDAEGGRGLLLIETLSADWGTFRPSAGGKIVWAEFARTTSAEVSVSQQRIPAQTEPAETSKQKLDKQARKLVAAALTQRVVDGLCRH